MLAHLLLSVVIAALPCEYVVDCSSAEQAVKFEAKLRLRFVTRDGQAIETSAKISPNPTGKVVAVGLTSVLDDCGWRYERLGDGVIVIRGSKTSPIQTVTFASDVWTPVVTRRLVLPEHPSEVVLPPPRGVQKK